MNSQLKKPQASPRWVRVYDSGCGMELFCRGCCSYYWEYLGDATRLGSLYPQPDMSDGTPRCPAPDCRGRKLIAGDVWYHADRYTVVYTGNYRGRNRQCIYLGMSSNPTHPQGVGMHGDADHVIDLFPSGFPATKLGDKGPGTLGRRIPFNAMPEAARNVAIATYIDIWNLPGHGDLAASKHNAV